ncbi:hypothetical protein NIES4101_84600 [Calothrix sp. NIES-4101]|nr:hypothetical protein NIES4101_84600 [Calothrix sp. NIES-4101]
MAGLLYTEVKGTFLNDFFTILISENIFLLVLKFPLQFIVLNCTCISIA